MDLRIEIRDEDDVVLDTIRVLQDGSDAYGSGCIRQLIREHYKTEADPSYDEFECDSCGKIDDIDDSIRTAEGELVCPTCAMSFPKRSE